MPPDDEIVIALSAAATLMTLDEARARRKEFFNKCCEHKWRYGRSVKSPSRVCIKCGEYETAHWAEDCPDYDY